MPRIKRIWLGPVIGFVIGALLPNELPIRFVAACALGLVGLFIFGYLQYIFALQNNKKLGFLGKEEAFIHSILRLASEIVRADGRIDDVQLDMIKVQISKDFSPEKSEKYFGLFKKFVERPSDLKKYCEVVDYEFDDSAKRHLMYLLVGLAASDGILTDNELKVLNNIAKLAHIGIPILMSTLRLFRFRREGYEEKTGNNSRKPPKRANNLKLKRAYQLFDLTESSSIDAIKKAYRRMAKLHHPDKVAHLGAGVQEKAKEKFQLIADAYETIKEVRRF